MAESECLLLFVHTPISAHGSAFSKNFNYARGTEGVQSLKELKVELALMLYTQKRFSFGQARQLAGMSYFDFEQLLVDRNIPAQYDVDEFEEDLKTLEQLRRGSRQ